MQIPPKSSFSSTDTLYTELMRLYQAVNTLEGKVRELERRAGVTNAPSSGSSSTTGLKQRISFPAASDPNATAQIYPGGNFTNVPTSSIDGSSIGLSFTGGPSFTVAIGSDSLFRSSINAPKKTAAAGPIVIGYRLTPAGNDGTVTINSDGTLTFTAAT